MRQYALLANLIHKIFSPPSKNDGKTKNDPTGASKSLSQQVPLKSKMPTGNNKVVILSNEDPNEQKLNFLLKGFNQTEATTGSTGKDTLISQVGNTHDGLTFKEDVKIDVTLRTQLGQAPVIMLLFTGDDRGLGDSSEESVLSKVSLSLEVGLNGRISVVDMTGLLDDGTIANSKLDAQADASQKPEAYELQSKIANVLEISQDIGILVEWILRWVRLQKGKG